METTVAGYINIFIIKRGRVKKKAREKSRRVTIRLIQGIKLQQNEGFCIMDGKPRRRRGKRGKKWFSMQILPRLKAPS